MKTKTPSQRTVSRILFPAFARVRACLSVHASAHAGETTIIPLGPALLTGSSSLPGDFGRAVLSSTSPARVAPVLVASLFGLAPCGVLPAICLTADAVRSYRTFSPLLARANANVSCVFSVPLSFGSPRPGVTRRTALRSSDFPRAIAASTASCEAISTTQARDRLVHYDGNLSVTSKL